MEAYECKSNFAIRFSDNDKHNYVKLIEQKRNEEQKQKLSTL